MGVSEYSSSSWWAVCGRIICFMKSETLSILTSSTFFAAATIRKKITSSEFTSDDNTPSFPVASSSNSSLSEHKETCLPRSSEDTSFLGATTDDRSHICGTSSSLPGNATRRTTPLFPPVSNTASTFAIEESKHNCKIGGGNFESTNFCGSTSIVCTCESCCTRNVSCEYVKVCGKEEKTSLSLGCTETAPRQTPTVCTVSKRSRRRGEASVFSTSDPSTSSSVTKRYSAEKQAVSCRKCSSSNDCFHVYDHFCRVLSLFCFSFLWANQTGTEKSPPPPPPLGGTFLMLKAAWATGCLQSCFALLNIRSNSFPSVFQKRMSRFFPTAAVAHYCAAAAVSFRRRRPVRVVPASAAAAFLLLLTLLAAGSTCYHYFAFFNLSDTSQLLLLLPFQPYPKPLLPSLLQQHQQPYHRKQQQHPKKQKQEKPPYPARLGQPQQRIKWQMEHDGNRQKLELQHQQQEQLPERKELLKYQQKHQQEVSEETSVNGHSIQVDGVETHLSRSEKGPFSVVDGDISRSDRVSYRLLFIADLDKNSRVLSLDEQQREMREEERPNTLELSSTAATGKGKSMYLFKSYMLNAQLRCAPADEEGSSSNDESCSGVSERASNTNTVGSTSNNSSSSSRGMLKQLFPFRGQKQTQVLAEREKSGSSSSGGFSRVSRNNGETIESIKANSSSSSSERGASDSNNNSTRKTKKGRKDSSGSREKLCTYSVSFGEEEELFHWQESVDGRGLELSELLMYGKTLLTFDDRSGLVYALSTEKKKLQPLWMVLEADGNTSKKGMKIEWATIKNNYLFVGSFGKEYTDNNGNILNYNNNWIVRIDSEGQMWHEDWTVYFQRMRKALGAEFPGYVIHEAINWSDALNKWVVLPRRISTEPYDEIKDERRGGNMLLLCNEDFTDIKVVQLLSKLDDMRKGFSSFKFFPGSGDRVLVALKSVEDSIQNLQQSYVTVIDIDGRVLMPDTLLPSPYKFEGVEFV